jgi:hypothetical protein
MKRLVGLLLVVVQLGTVAVPLAAEPAAGHECEASIGYQDPGTVQPLRDCGCCEMPECSGMLACAMGATAITTDVAVSFVPPVVSASDPEVTSSQAAFLKAPIPPPPQA